jgi:hypothetical protein
MNFLLITFKLNLLTYLSIKKIKKEKNKVSNELFYFLHSSESECIWCC